MATILENITLTVWIAYTGHIQQYDEQMRAIRDAPTKLRRHDVLLQGIAVKKAIATARWFERPETDVESSLRFCDELYTGIAGVVDAVEIDFGSVTFGQFIDAKMITQGAQEGGNRWQVMQYIMAIFGSGVYDPQVTAETHPHFVAQGAKTLPVVLRMVNWWEGYNQHVSECFTLFQESGEREGEHMREHMRRWGWVNFLKSVAKTKVFDLPGSGKNSIDCVREAKCEDVLLWASEEKDYNIAMGRDMKEMYSR